MGSTTASMAKEYILPRRILASFKAENGAALLKDGYDQPVLHAEAFCTLQAGGYILLDFGTEISGGAQLIVYHCGEKRNAEIRIRFGESAMEARADLGEKNAGNDHAVRDAVIYVSRFGQDEYGNTGFRFIRVDNADSVPISFLQIKAVWNKRIIDRAGRFSCGDGTVDKIYETGAHTVYLNMQNYIYDGVKRDRLVWMGDLHPEISAIAMLYGYDGIVEKTLDFMRDGYGPDTWMNGIPSYSMWWLITHRTWYGHFGNAGYLARQKGYMKKLALNLAAAVRPDGSYALDERFFDWPSRGFADAENCGVHALLVIALRAAAEMLRLLGEEAAAGACLSSALRLEKNAPDFRKGNKGSAALLVLAGLADAETADRELFRGGADGVSPFMAYYIFSAMAKAGNTGGALRVLKEYYGAMLSLGATSFWEAFDIDWLKGAKPVDALLEAGEYDVHGDNGKHCYTGYRNSLCHGWACGFVAFLYERVLGIRILEPGCKKLRISPDLGDLKWAEGTMPTPYGTIRVRAEKKKNGQTETEVYPPSEKIEIVRRNEYGG
ncbi:MAG: alpha-L-rhamnosidase [Clostridiales bacterium]|jgi:hypothetical protein|nr:alpha-L-rhamnosidase [Clostridiales bacterium]